MNSVFILVMDVGEYDDHVSANICAFVSKEEADLVCEKYNQLNSFFNELRRAYYEFMRDDADGGIKMKLFNQDNPVPNFPAQPKKKSDKIYQAMNDREWVKFIEEYKRVTMPKLREQYDSAYRKLTDYRNSLTNEFIENYIATNLPQDLHKYRETYPQSIMGDAAFSVSEVKFYGC